MGCLTSPIEAANLIKPVMVLHCSPAKDKVWPPISSARRHGRGESFPRGSVHNVVLDEEVGGTATLASGKGSDGLNACVLEVPLCGKGGTAKDLGHFRDGDKPRGL